MRCEFQNEESDCQKSNKNCVEKNTPLIGQVVESATQKKDENFGTKLLMEGVVRNFATLFCKK
jgi:hypothetical protein